MGLAKTLTLLFVLASSATSVGEQPDTCPPQGWTLAQLEALKKDAFKIADTFQRHELAVALTACLGHPKPELRDGIAFEALSSWMRGGLLDVATIRTIRGDLLKALARTDAGGFR